MNKKTLTFTLSSAIASSLLSVAPSIQAGENPFALSNVNSTQQMAVADEKMNAGGSGKLKEGKCGEGKCGAGKMKMKEGGPSNEAMQKEKMKEGEGDKMKDGGSNGKM